MTIKQRIEKECSDIKEMLLSKNKEYGNSALEPVRIFAKSDAQEQIKVRIDDKLNRIMQGKANDTEDTVKDLIGYLTLLRISEEDVQ